MTGRPAVFLDRDGVLNRDRVPTVLRLADLEVLPRAGEAVAALRKAGWFVAIVTNKTAMGWGLLSPATHEAIMAELLRRIEPDGGIVDAVYHCPHNPLVGCDCRKPRPGMLQRAAREHGLDLARSWMVGDTWRDVEAGKAAGCRTIVVGPSARARRHAPDFEVSDLWAAAQVVLRVGDPLRNPKT